MMNFSGGGGRGGGNSVCIVFILCKWVHFKGKNALLSNQFFLAADWCAEKQTGSHKRCLPCQNMAEHLPNEPDHSISYKIDLRLVKTHISLHS